MSYLLDGTFHPVDVTPSNGGIISYLASGANGYAAGDTGGVDGGTATYTVDSVGPGGVPTAVTVSLTGGGYTTGWKTTTPGGAQPGVGSGLYINVIAINGVFGVIGNNLGLNYTAGDVITIAAGGFNATGTVLTTGIGGRITGFAMDTIGSGYSTGSNIATLGGTGTGFTVDIAQIIGIAQYVFATASGSAYLNGDTGTIDGGTPGQLAHYKVTDVDPINGGVLRFILTSTGAGYTAGTVATTTKGAPQAGAGTGLLVLINSVTTTGTRIVQTSETWPIWNGPVESNGALWLAGHEYSPTNQASFYKSTDNETTWQFVAGLPKSSNWDEEQSLVWDRGNNWVLITALYGTGVQFWRFHMDTGLWDVSPGTVVADANYGTTYVFGVKQNCLAIDRNDPNIMIYAVARRDQGTGLYTSWYYRTIDGGTTWAAPVQIGSGVFGPTWGPIISGAVFDNAGILHIVIQATPGVGHFAAYYAQVASDGSLAVDASLIYDGLSMFADAVDDVIYNPNANEILMANVVFPNPGPPRTYFNVIRGAINGGAPLTLTTENLFTGNSAGTNYLFFVRRQDENYDADLVLFADNGPDIVDEGVEIFEQVNRGSWAMSVFWDRNDTPLQLPPGATFAFIQEAWGTIIDGTLYAVIGGDINFVSSTMLTARTYTPVAPPPPAPPPPLSIICDFPPPGVVGVFYTHTFPTTGGVPPLTFSITAGALPAGLTLDPATGIVSGIPLAIAAYSFTITVVDSIGQTASASCAIGTRGGSPFPPPSGPCVEVILYEWQPSFIIKREYVLHRATDYTDCGYTGRKFIRGFRLHANTFNVPRTIRIEYDGGQIGPSFIAVHNGEETIAYSITPVDQPQPLVATYVRLVNIDPVPADWILWDQETTWEFDPYPDLTTLRTPWSHPSGGGLCWVQGIRLTADTANLPAQLNILGDGNVVVQSIMVSHNGQQTKPYTWPPFLTHDIAIQPLQPCAIWTPDNLAWVFTPVPENVSYWVARPTSFGMEGYFHIRDGIFAYGEGPGQLVITMDTGEVFTLAIPATTDAEAKLYFPTNPLKGKLATISAIGAPTLRIYVEDIELRIKQWGSTGPWQIARIPGDISKVEARI